MENGGFWSVLTFMRAISGGPKIRALGEMVVVDGALASVVDGRKGVHYLDDGVMAADRPVGDSLALVDTHMCGRFPHDVFPLFSPCCCDEIPLHAYYHPQMRPRPTPITGRLSMVPERRSTENS